MFPALRSVIGLTAASIAAWIIGGVLTSSGITTDESDWKKVLPEPDLLKLIDQSAKALQDAAKSPSQFNLRAMDAEREAYVLAIYAYAGMHAGNDELAKKSAALREAALAFAESAKKRSFNKAKQQLATITGFKTLKVSTATGHSELPLNKAVPIASLMMEVNNVEKEFQKYRRLNLAQFNAKVKSDEIALNSRKMAALTLAMEAHAPEKDEKEMTKKAWLDAVSGVRAAAVDMADSAKAKKPTDWKQAYQRMTSSCTKCHEVFRVESN